MSAPDVNVEILAHLDGFLLDHSTLGDTLLDTEPVWVPYIGKMTNCEVTRGGAVDGVSTKLAPGAMTVRLHDATGQMDLDADPVMRPGRRARLARPTLVDQVRVDESVSLAVPWVNGERWQEATLAPSTVQSGFVRFAPTINSGGMIAMRIGLLDDDPVGAAFTARMRVRVPASDGGSMLMVSLASRDGETVHAWPADWTVTPAMTDMLGDGSMLYAAMPEGTWVDVEIAGKLPPGLPYFIQVAVSSTQLWGPQIDVAELSYRVVGDIERPLITGTLLDYETDEHKDGPVGATLIIADPVQSLANTTRYGAYGDGTGERWADRIARLARSAQTSVETPSTRYQQQTIYADPRWWRRFGTKHTRITAAALRRRAMTNGFSGLYNSTTGTGSWSQAAYSYGVEVPLADAFVPGRRYVIEMPVRVNFAAGGGEGVADLYSLGVVGLGWCTPVLAPRLNGAKPAMLRFAFTATAASHTVRVACAEPISNTGTVGEAVVIGDGTIYHYGEQDYWLQDIAYESDLRNHFSLACDSVGARWWPGRDGVVRFAAAASGTVRLWLADQLTEDGQVSYTDLNRSTGTRDVVTDIELVNHGRDAESGNTADTTTLYSDVTSVATWGNRSASVDVSIDPTGGALDRRGRELLSAGAVLRSGPRGVTFRALDAIDATTDLELYDHVLITRRSTTWRCEVVGIRHQVTPRGWTVTLTLRTLDQETTT